MEPLNDDIPEALLLDLVLLIMFGLALLQFRQRLQDIVTIKALAGAPTTRPIDATATLHLEHRDSLKILHNLNIFQ